MGAPMATFGAPMPTFGAPMQMGVQPYPSVPMSAAPMAAMAPAPMPVMQAPMMMSYVAAPPPQPVMTTVMETQVDFGILEILPFFVADQFEETNPHD